jgi:hypothetical protein
MIVINYVWEVAMEPLRLLDQEHDWQYLLTFLPNGWQQKAKELGALLRSRNFPNAEVLLRILLIHLADGCSLRETVIRAKRGNLVSVTDVALLKRLKSSGEWLRWMAEELMRTWIERQPSSIFASLHNIRIIDGSNIQEPGSTGSNWRLHYSICLPSLRCDEVYVTSPKVGESFKRFNVKHGDLFLGDRGYAQRPGIFHVINGGGEVLVRLNLTNVPLVKSDGTPFPLLEHLRSLEGTKIGDWEVWVPFDSRLIPGRICAIKKNKEATEKAHKKALRENGRKGAKVKPETIESAGYIFVFTTLKSDIRPSTILEMYRGRWQVELVFKRLKSIIGIGHLKKTDVEASKAWIHGKLLVAFLLETLIVAGERFFPWGYPIKENVSQETMCLEGNIIYASPSQ